MKTHKLPSLPKRFQPLNLRRFSPPANLHARQTAIVSALSAHDKAQRFRINSVLQRTRSEASSPVPSPSNQSPLPGSSSPSPLPFLMAPTPRAAFAALALPREGKINRKERTRRALGALRHLLQLRIPRHWISRLKLLVPQTPCAAPQSRQFLMACRTGDIEAVTRMLVNSRWLALEFDRVRRTGLHWAARRAHTAIIDELLKHGAFIDARDSIGRTPLFVAAKAGNVSAVGLLLSYKASPFVRTFGGESPVVVAQHPLVRRLLVRTMQVTILLKFAEASCRRVLWEEVKALLRAELRKE